jgi:quercetin dioxygenase-like cupin family protein
MGVARLPPGGALHTHHHDEHEAYLVLDGSGVLTIDGTAQQLRPGVAAFIPGGAAHSVEATGETDLRVAYVLAADSFEDVEYVFAA